ncbi:stage VI sporulation protein D [Bacillus fengqiuensis]|nr:stage VI sporulation protein D [Bacillus fengqiuensis]
MTQDNLSCLRFSIEESVWFQRGQEVSELLSISLDPNISIQEDEQYVSIRGALILTGEYKNVQSDTEEQSLREYMNGKQIHEVLLREDGMSEFQHQFPLDITIPKNRIQNLEDVYVSIDMFDYDFPSENNLSLTADLSITGLYGEQQSVARLEDEEQEEIMEVQQEETEQTIFLEQQEEEADEFEFEPLYRNGNELKEEQQEDKQAVIEFEPLLHQQHEEYNEEQQEVQGIERLSAGDTTPDSYFADSSLSHEEELYEPFEVEVKKEQPHEAEAAAVPSFELRAKNMIPLWAEEENAEAETREKAYQQYAEVPKAEQVEEEEKAEKAVRKENALYLTQLFSKNEEEDFSRLKMCIVQNGDSLEQIAERYDTNVQNLLRVNNIEDEHDLSEGTILTIPVGSKR